MSGGGRCGGLRGICRGRWGCGGFGISGCIRRGTGSWIRCPPWRIRASVSRFFTFRRWTGCIAGGCTSACGGAGGG
ncbi:MAG TPA: hypothetical protein DD757_10970 [Alcanivorax sp.]|nr:hypothetical protein [Alcanivorax sp.]HBY50551.1 hypothetical protein [Alcanivorax sp.]